jgi:hypothetical protein
MMESNGSVQQQVQDMSPQLPLDPTKTYVAPSMLQLHFSQLKQFSSISTAMPSSPPTKKIVGKNPK